VSVACYRFECPRPPCSLPCVIPGVCSAFALTGLLTLTSTATWAAVKDRKPPSDAEVEAIKGKDVIGVLETDRGAITLELFADDAPYTVANIKKLADDGFYDGIEFHRVIPDFYGTDRRRRSRPRCDSLFRYP